MGAGGRPARRRTSPERRYRLLLVLLAAYVFARAALGATVNPPLIGPDEGGHLEYVGSLVASAGRRVTGV